MEKGGWGANKNLALYFHFLCGLHCWNLPLEGVCFSRLIQTPVLHLNHLPWNEEDLWFRTITVFPEGENCFWKHNSPRLVETAQTGSGDGIGEQNQRKTKYFLPSPYKKGFLICAPKDSNGKRVLTWKVFTVLEEVKWGNNGQRLSKTATFPF